jgi:hypothetical protein
VLAGFVLLGRWYAQQRATPVLAPTTLAVPVDSGADRGPGTLREALFVADTASSAARVIIHVARITLESSLPPIVNPHGIEIVVPPGGVQIDAHALRVGTPVFDIDAEHTTLSGLLISHCPGSAILVRAARFRLTASTIEACDVGVEVAATASDIALERNSFQGNRIGIRFSAASADTEVVKNEFSGNSTAGMWLVASAPTTGDGIQVHDNQFRDGTAGVVLGNIPALLEHNEFSSLREAAVHVVGADAVISGNHISSGPAAGIIVEDARGALIDGNELDHLQGYAILLRGAADTLVRANRIHSCGYGMAFVLGDQQRPNTAVENTFIDLYYNGIDVIGESPILRRNQVLQARAYPLHVTDFSSPNGTVVRARPLLERNSFPLASSAALMRRGGAERR